MAEVVETQLPVKVGRMTTDQSVGYYDKTFSGAPQDARELLEKYAKVPTGEVDDYMVQMASSSAPPLPGLPLLGVPAA